MSSEFAAMKREEQELYPLPSAKPSKSTKQAKLSKPTPPPPNTKLTMSTPKVKTNKQALYIPIIQESTEFVCINKPPSLLSQPGLAGEGTILDLLSYQRPDLTLQTVNR
jgi:23S rRNA-/tRNA-specific pseudouridylate synthase